MSAREDLSKACAALAKARAALAVDISEQEQRLEAAEFGPHGQAAAVQGETERLDALRATDELLESSLEDLEQAASDLERLL